MDRSTSALHRFDDLIEAPRLRCDHGDAERGELPRVLVIDLGDRQAHLSRRAMSGRNTALCLQRLRLVDVEFDPEQGSVGDTVNALL